MRDTTKRTVFAHFSLEVEWARTEEEVAQELWESLVRQRVVKEDDDLGLALIQSTIRFDRDQARIGMEANCE